MLKCNLIYGCRNSKKIMVLACFSAIFIGKSLSGLITCTHRSLLQRQPWTTRASRRGGWRGVELHSKPLQNLCNTLQITDIYSGIPVLVNNRHHEGDPGSIILLYTSQWPRMTYIELQNLSKCLDTARRCKQRVFLVSPLCVILLLSLTCKSRWTEPSLEASRSRRWSGQRWKASRPQHFDTFSWENL